MFREFAEAYTSIPEDHVGMLIGLVAVVGGLILGGLSIWQGINLQFRMAETRSQLVLQMLNAGLSCHEVLSVLDHPGMSSMTNGQRKHSKAIQQLLESHNAVPPQKPVKPVPA